MLRRAFTLALLLVGLAAAASAQSPLAGRYEGTLKIMGRDLAIVVSLAGDTAAPTGTIDIPQQGATGLPLTNVRAEGAKVHFELQAGPALAAFDGEVKGDRIEGTFERGPAKGTFELKKGAPAAPAAPLPYRQEEVKIENGGLVIAGTLTLPQSAGPHPAIVLITGSGAQNRDEEVFGFKVFGVLADKLTRAGFAVLRCDDRGVGGSTGSVPESTSADFAGDVMTEVKFLAARPEIDRTRIGLLGHSEGGMIAPLVATRSGDIAFIVLLSGPALTGEKIMLAQGELIGRAEGQPEAQIQENMKLQRTLFAAARDNKGWDEVLATVKAAVRKAVGALPEAQRNAIPDVDRMVEAQAQGQVNFVRSPWFRYFLDYDPAPTLARVNCPVLAIFGEKDLQVPTEANRAVMDDVAKKSGNRDFTIVVIPGANHLYQAATTGGASEYPRLKKEFAPGFEDALIPWLTKHTRK
jgi:pimeloyl-ACP methyl ester carboxylesterase